MIKNPFKPTAKLIAFLACSAVISSTGSAFATVSQEPISTHPSTVLETREILERASQIALQGMTTLQQIQTLSGEAPSTEMLKNYMASLIYVPRSSKLPTDAEALDEPWNNTDAHMTEDGMVIPHLDDADSTSHKGVDIDIPTLGSKKIFKLLQPVQNALVSSGFGIRWGRPHQGIDMAAPIGTPIMAAESGKVAYSGWKAGYGNFIEVDHGHGYLTHYAHCSKLLVHVGQVVKKGQPIGKVGNTGNSTGPHLHFEVLANGVHRNPAKFLDHTLTVVNAK